MHPTYKFIWFCFCAAFVFTNVSEAAMPKDVKFAYHKDNCLQNESAQSCAWLGAMLEKQGKRNKARPFYKRACHALIQPLGPACYLWGLLEPDAAKRQAAFARACKLKDADGCTAIGELWMRKRQLEKALRYYKKACENKDGRGCHRYAGVLFAKKQLARSMELLRRSCRLGYPPGCGSLGWLYQSKTKQPKQALRAYSVGCKLRGAAACARLGLLLRKRKKAKRAKKAFLLACKYGYKKACGWAKGKM